MGLHPIEGHERPMKAIGSAFAREKLPKVLLLHGPKGIGKQRLALWAGQLVLCSESTAQGPCGTCRDCRLVLRLEHPDLLWYFPLKRPPSRGSKERDQEALEEARIEGLVQRRETPLRVAYSEELLGLQVGTVRNLRREANRGPGLSARRVFVIADAEELVAQDASPEAANALLKILEEPPASSWFFLTSSEPGRVPPTVRSRATSLYLPPLAQSRVRDFLIDRMKVPEDEASRAARLSEGSIGRALGLVPTGDEPTGPLERVRRDAEGLLAAALSARAGDRFGQALAYPPAGARGLGELLSFVEAGLRDLAVEAAVRGEEPARGAGARVTVDALRAARSIAHVEEARKKAASNVNPQLLVSQLLADLHDELVPTVGNTGEVP